MFALLVTFSDNAIGLAGIKAVAAVLPRLERLKDLNLQ